MLAKGVLKYFRSKLRTTGLEERTLLGCLDSQDIDPIIMVYDTDHL